MNTKDIEHANGYVQQVYERPVKRYCQALDLIDEPALIAQYIEAHSAEHHWREIVQGLKEVGVLEMEIYLKGNRLFMVVETGLDFEWAEAFSKLEHMPRQAEWEKRMSFFQLSDAQTATDKWQLMDRIFNLYRSDE